jgi:iron complex transport system substrate-binding protein
MGGKSGVMKGLAVLALLWGLWSAGWAAPFEVRDDRGKAVAFAAPPQRIVSLLPSLTETVCDLGACGRLVGVDRYSNHPKEITRLPRLGGGLDPNIEAVLALRPDVVLMAGSSRAVERLEALGLRVLAMEPKSMAEMEASVRALSMLLQGEAAGAKATADAAWQRLQDGLDAAGKQMAASRVRPVRQRVFMQVSPALHAAGEASFIGEVLKRIGLDNIVPASLGVFPLVSPEWVLRADPDWIILSQSQVHTLPQRPGWANMRAVSQGRFCALTQDQADTLSRPGPRLPMGAQAVAACVSRRAP